MPHRADTAEMGQREAELSQYRDSRSVLIFSLVNGHEIVGAVRWFDDIAIRIVQADRSELTLMLRAVIYYRTR